MWGPVLAPIEPLYKEALRDETTEKQMTDD